MRWLEEPPPSSALVVNFGNAHIGAALGGVSSVLCVRLSVRVRRLTRVRKLLDRLTSGLLHMKAHP